MQKSLLKHQMCRNGSLGEPVFDRLDADIAKALMSINVVKGVEIGSGFDSVAQKGTEHRDEITPDGFFKVTTLVVSWGAFQAGRI